MSNNSNPNYFRLGAFVLAAIGVLIAVILIFGGGKFFAQKITLGIKKRPVQFDHDIDVDGTLLHFRRQLPFEVFALGARRELPKQLIILF